MWTITRVVGVDDASGRGYNRYVIDLREGDADIGLDTVYLISFPSYCNLLVANQNGDELSNRILGSRLVVDSKSRDARVDWFASQPGYAVICIGGSSAMDFSVVNIGFEREIVDVIVDLHYFKGQILRTRRVCGKTLLPLFHRVIALKDVTTQGFAAIWLSQMHTIFVAMYGSTPKGTHQMTTSRSL